MSGQTNWIDRMLCYLNAGEPWIVSVRDCAQYHNAVMALRAELAAAKAELVSKTDELAAAIKQRDEARREVCELDAEIYGHFGDIDRLVVHRASYMPMDVAKDRGWDCFAEKEVGGA